MLINMEIRNFAHDAPFCRMVKLRNSCEELTRVQGDAQREINSSTMHEMMGSG